MNGFCRPLCSLAAAAALGLALAPVAGAAPPPASTADLLAADRAFEAATVARGAAGWGSFFAAEGIAVPPSGPLPKGGPAAAEAEMKGLFADPKAALRWQPEQAVLAKSGELGYTIGSYELHATGPGGNPVTRKGRYLTVWRRQADGSWKVLADIGNVAPPPPPAPAASQRQR
ncbi:MAG: YybH family protein [Acidobacteriota bacterium]